MTTVLIVDDYPPNLVALELAIEAADCDFIAARSGREALEVLAHTDVALILTDLQMHDVSGSELVLEVRRGENNRDVPVILLSGAESNDPRIQAATALPGVSFVQKPYSVESLRKQIARALHS